MPLIGTLEIARAAREGVVAGQGSGPGSLHAILALARAEGRRLLRHPAVAGGVLLSIAAYVLATLYYGAPVMQRDDILTGAALLPVAAGTLLAANLAALRSRRHGTDELFDSQALSREARTLGHLLSVLWAGALAVGVVGVFLVTLILRRPVGAPDGLELLTGPTIVIVVGVVGILLARWLPSPATGPLAIVAIGAVSLWASATGPGGQLVTSRIRWLVPWVSLSNGGNPPRELAIRPAGWHLAYLVGIAIAVAGLALLRHGRRPSSVALVAGGVVLAIAGAAVIVRPVPIEEARALGNLIVHPARYQVCETRAGVQFCAYRGYVGWIDRWAEAVTPVVEPVPSASRPAGLTVRQTFAMSYGGDLDLGLADRLSSGLQTPGGPAVRTGSSWAGEGVTEAEVQMSLALGIAAWVVGMPVTSDQVVLTKADVRRLVNAAPLSERKDVADSLHPGDVYGSCVPAGQARAVVALWLAGQATPSTDARLREVTTRRFVPRPIPSGFFGTEAPTEQVLVGDDGASTVAWDELFVDPNGNAYVATGGAINWTRLEAEYAVQLLDRPRAEVSATLANHWDELVAPRTATGDLVALFGLRAVPTVEGRLEDLGVPADVAARAAVAPLEQSIRCH